MATTVVTPFHLDLTPDEIAELQGQLGEILRAKELTLGCFTEKFEQEFACYTGSRYAVAVNTGTSALEILLRIHNAEGNLVGVPTNTNFATPTAVLLAGGKPVFLDMTERTFMPNLAILEEACTRYPLKGVVWVHIGGLISPDLPEVISFCKNRDMFFIEDAAHAHGSRLAGKHAGIFADGGAFSFFPTKVMTTMEGGMIVTNQEEVAKLAKSYRNQGKGEQKYGSVHYQLGSSLRMLEISAAMGLIQLRKLEWMLSRRKAVVERLCGLLDEIGIEYCDSSHMQSASNYKLIVKCDEYVSVEVMKKRFLMEGVVLGGGVYERPCHLQPVFQDRHATKGPLPVAEKLCPRHICPPVTSGLTDADIERVAVTIQKCLRQ